MNIEVNLFGSFSKREKAAFYESWSDVLFESAFEKVILKYNFIYCFILLNWRIYLVYCVKFLYLKIYNFLSNKAKMSII